MDNATIKKRNLQRINDAAMKLFFEKGIDATTVNDIAKLARVSKVSIYKHFDSKLDIALSIADKLYQEFTTNVAAHVFDSTYDSLTGFDQIKRIVESYTALQDDDPIYYIFLTDLSIFTLRHRNEFDTPLAVDRFSDILRPRFVSALAKGTRDRTVATVGSSPAEMYEIVSAAFRGVYLSYFFSSTELTGERKRILRERLDTVAAWVLTLMRAQ